MSRYPGILRVEAVLRGSETSAFINGRYVPARPLAFCDRFQRFKAAWLVFTGRADALLWPGQES